MNTVFPFLQIRVARPTAHLERVLEFYQKGLGLSELYRFEDHDGYSGVMLGMPDASYHLEFIQREDGAALPLPSKDSLIVFYLGDVKQRDSLVQRISEMEYKIVSPENPYWNEHGVTIEDPDGWRVVLMATAGLKDNNL